MAQKNIIVLFCLALILSPFGGLAGQVYANEDDSVEASEELTEEQTDAVDKESLEAKLTKIDDAGLVEVDYTDKSFQALQGTVTAAELVFSDDDALQDAVDESLTTLTEDYEALKEAEEQTKNNEPTAEAAAENDNNKDDGADIPGQDEATNDEKESGDNETDKEDAESKK